MAESTLAARRRRRSKWTLRLIALAYVGVLVVMPLTVVLWRTIQQGGTAFINAVTSDEAIHAFQLTGIVAGSAVVLNTLFGVTLAYLMSRYRWWGKSIVNALVDIPVSVSPIVVGLSLILVFGWRTGWFGHSLREADIKIIFATPGMILATCFVALPLVLREVLPVLEEIGIDQEQAARSLGANAWQRFVRITLPTIKWALAYGVVLSVARTLGEFGAVRVVSGNVGGQTQTVTLLVDQRAEQFEPGAYQLAVVLIAVAALCIAAISLIRPADKESH